MSSHSRPVTQSSHNALILAGMVLLSVGAFLAFSAVYYRAGFPLDDAWIHQTYARNLALRGEWSFIPGQVSGGSTAPLWSALLAVGYWLKLAPYVWTYLLGAAALWGLAMLGEKMVRTLVPLYRPRFPWVGAALTLEWHLAWAAVSGMETLLSTLLITTVLTMLLTGSRKYTGLGLLTGLAVWIRPDGITLLGPVVLYLLLERESWGGRLHRLVDLGVGFGSVFTFYLLFNWIVSRSPWPNTFYAKQAEYASYLQLPFLDRLGAEAIQPLIGAGVLLLPGLIVVLVSASRSRSWRVWIVLVWFLGYLSLYALRLPVTYQHGRYVIPAMPIFFLLGLAGLVQFVSVGGPRWRWYVQAFWKLAAMLVLIVFWGRGMFAYGQDVAVIESEMVAAARWVSANLPPQSLVAAHDIGALGYFGNHDLVDLAGLVSPEVRPFIRDEARIAAYLDARGVEYLVTFPDWYPQLTRDLVPIFETGAPYAPALGQPNMSVYKWASP